MKKLLALDKYDYDGALIIDSEALAVQPFEMRRVFAQQALEPIVWRSREGRDIHKPYLASAARVLGRDITSFGSEHMAVLESMIWYFEPHIWRDMVAWIEAAHGRPFWDVFLGEETAAWEMSVYHMHIHMRKVETAGDSPFARYKVLEGEREATRYGLGPSISILIPNRSCNIQCSLYLMS